MERETGIEPATNSLEGCDSTTELLPPTPLGSLRRLAASARHARRRVHPCLAVATTNPSTLNPSGASIEPRRMACHPKLAVSIQRRAKDGGEGRTRTFEGARPTDLQSAAFDRFATSPIALFG